MDSGSENMNDAIMPYIGVTKEDGNSQESSARASPMLRNGDSVKLFVDEFGEVGVGSIVEARPQGQWLSVPIPVEPWTFVLLRPLSLISKAGQCRLKPCQRGLRTMMDALSWTVLWRVSDILKSSGDPPMDSSPHICQEDWTELEVHLKDFAGLLISSGRINCWRPDDHFQDTTLGEEQIGVTVLDVFVGNPEDIMTHARWPILDC